MFGVVEFLSFNIMQLQSISGLENLPLSEIAVPDLLKGQLALVLILLIGLVIGIIFKYWKDRRIWVYYQDTPQNREIVKVLNPLIKRYSPTVYLPLSIMKMYLSTDRKIPLLDVYMRMDVTLADGEVCALDWYPRNYKTMAEDTPIVFYVPGVFGVSKDKYAYHFCKICYKTLGWRTFVYNRRLLLLEPKGNKLNSYECSADWKEVVDTVKRQFPRADIYLVGVSMGALNSQRYLIDYSENSGIKAAVTISSPWNAKKASDHIKGHKLFLKVLLAAQMKMVKQHMHSEKFLELLEKKGIDINKVLSSKSNREFDQNFALPDLTLEHTDLYYERLSTDTKLDQVRIPLLSINSMDDILIPPSQVPLEQIKQNANIIQLMVSGGGHIEYYHTIKRKYWAYMACMEYFRYISKHPAHPIISQD